MPPILIAYPVIDPVLVHLGPLPIRWYALSYIGALLGGWASARFLVGRATFWGTRTHATVLSMDDLVVYMAAGIILGGRIGYVLFYNFPFYRQHPLDALYVWYGGMSFHGGFLGATLAMTIFAWRSRVSVLSVTDAVAPGVPDRHRVGQARQLHQAGAVGPPDRCALGDDLSGLGRAAPASEPAL